MIAHHSYSVHHVHAYSKCLYVFTLTHNCFFNILLMMLADFYVYMSLSINDLFCHSSVIFTLR